MDHGFGSYEFLICNVKPVDHRTAEVTVQQTGKHAGQKKVYTAAVDVPYFDERRGQKVLITVRPMMGNANTYVTRSYDKVMPR